MTTRGIKPILTLAALLVGAGLLAACVSDEQAVDMGLATACDGTATFRRLDDPAGRYLTANRTEVCRGPKKDAGTRQQIIVVDCTAMSELTATVAQDMADPRRHGPAFDRRTAAETQVTRLKVGLTDFAGLQSGLQGAEVPFVLTPGKGIEQCAAMAKKAG